MRKMLAVAAGSLMALTLAAGPASAKGGDVIRTGSCSAQSHWKLKAGVRDEGVEIEFQVDSNRVGQTWSVQILDNGATVFSGRRVTQAPSGSFSVRKVTANRAGADNIVGRARNVATGETCRGTLAV
jgi:hypothetical protein